MSKIGIIITIEHYQRSGLRDVDYATNDGDAMQKIFIEKFGIEETDLSRYTDAEFTASTINNEIKYIMKNLRNDDELFIYYAGHGFLSNGKNYLTAYDSVMDKSMDENMPEDTSLCIDTDILSPFLKSQAKSLVFFIDACADQLDKSRGIGFEDIEVDAKKLGFTDDMKYAIFFACKPKEQSYPEDAFKHGLWSHFLINALNGKEELAFDKDGSITTKTLDAYLIKAIPEYIKINKKPYIQNPRSVIAESQDWILVNSEESETYGKKLDRLCSSFLSECTTINEIMHFIPNRILFFDSARKLCEKLEDIIYDWDPIISAMEYNYNTYQSNKDYIPPYHMQEKLFNDIERLIESLESWREMHL